jgi:P-type conjugative transfer ATPase TrbB
MEKLMRNSEQTKQRKVDALHDAMGTTIAAALADPTVTEVMVNPDGRIWIDRFSTGMTAADKTLSPSDAESILRILADHAQVVVSADSPRVSATLPLTNERFQGEFPPIVENPSFAIRKPATRIFTIDEYTAQGVMTPEQAVTIRQAVADHLNILVIGGTGSGKTTLLNALLAEPALIPERILIIEQTRELQCIAPNLIKLQTREIAPFVTMTDLVRDALRLRPDRIIVGEVRDGAAWDMIKSWNTGHDGGFGTIHANSPIDALYRVEDLIGEVMQRIPYRAIGAAINLIIEIKRTPHGRRITSILRVNGYENGNYSFNYCES